MSVSRQSLVEGTERNEVDATMRSSLLDQYRRIRSATAELARPLSAEDCVVQSMPDASPVNWHLGHTTWFFETFVLDRPDSPREPFHPGYRYLFNSYYNSVGDRQPRSQRGLITRPSLQEILAYRAAVDAAMAECLSGNLSTELVEIVEIGLHHEQQHQELMLTDVKHLLSCNPLRPPYRDDIWQADQDDNDVVGMRWETYSGGVCEIGHAGDNFAYDNECPRHRVYLNSYALSSRLVTNGEYLMFIDDGGYERPEYWLSDGWDSSRKHGWEAPLYWEQREGEWCSFTLSGMRPIVEAEPVCHLSYYEADAFARWAEARLPTEAEWESAAAEIGIDGPFVEEGALHPQKIVVATEVTAPLQMFGNVWQWTSSPYTAYPGYQPAAGALGEYNGKFMCNQMVLRGGSCATSRTHIRETYRNFFAPELRWQFSGLRLARDA